MSVREKRIGGCIVATYDIFQEGIEKEIKEKNPNLYKVADWVKRCRNYIRDHKTIDVDPVTKAEQIKDFFNAWEKHYTNNPDFYNSELYRGAIRINGKETDKVIIYVEDFPIDFTEYFNLSLVTDFHHNIVDKFKKRQIETFNDYLEIISSLNSFKPNDSSVLEEIYEKIHGTSSKPSSEELTLRKVIVDIIRYSKTNYEYEYYINDLELNIPNIDEIRKIKDANKMITEKEKSKIKAILPITDMISEYIEKEDYQGMYDYLESILVYKKDTFIENEQLETDEIKLIDEMDLLGKLNEFNITKDTWYPFKKDMQKNTDKKFFYNLGMFLSLDEVALESLMQIHGFSYLNSWDEKDLFYRQYIKIGLGIDYINSLFKELDKKADKKNYYSLKKKFNNKNNYLTYIYHYEHGTRPLSIKKYNRGKGKDITEGQYKEALIAIVKKLNISIDKIQGKYNYKMGKLDKEIEKLDRLDDKIKIYKKEIEKIKDDSLKNFEEESLKNKKTKAENRYYSFIKNPDGSYKPKKELLEDERAKLLKWITKLDYKDVLWDFNIEEGMNLRTRSLREWGEYKEELEQKLNDLLGINKTEEL